MWITLWMSLLGTTKKETTLQAQPIVTTSVQIENVHRLI